MVGPDLTLAFNDIVEINFQYLLRNDKQPLNPTLIKDAVETKGMMGEFILTPNGDKSKWYAAALYNWQKSDLAAYDISRVTGHLGWVLRTNLRLYGEFTYDAEFKYGQFGVGFVSAF